MVKRGVSVVVCAYNEAPRISKVLKTLIKTKILDEIIIINDGSTDNTEKIIKKIKNKKIKYLKNKKNKGKGYSMNLGVRVSKYNVILFCDADLKGISPKIIKKITEPVLKNKVNMFIGVRNLWSYRLIRKLNIYYALFFLSGQRALKKYVWLKLPSFYKKGFRIETGLNYFSKIHAGSFEYDVFNYTHTNKRKKMGVIKGLKETVKMYKEITFATIRFILYDKWKQSSKLLVNKTI